MIESCITEAQVEIRRFEAEARQALKERGYHFFTIQPKSIAEMLVDNEPFGYVNSAKQLRNFVDYQAFEAAVNPQELTIPESNYQPLRKQQKMIGAFSRSLRKKIPAIKAIMGQAPVYCQLDFEYQRENDGKKLLVGLYARTPTKTAGSFVARVGRLDADDHLYVGGWRRDYDRDSVWAVPVVVPANLELGN